VSYEARLGSPSSPSPLPAHRLHAGVEGEREHKAQQQQEPRVKVEGGRIVVEREVELETIWGVRRIALDPRVYILYAYAQKYLGYNGSLGEFLSDCTVLFFKERGIEVTLKLPETAPG
jgi:hypothetical protein